MCFFHFLQIQDKFNQARSVLKIYKISIFEEIMQKKLKHLFAFKKNNYTCTFKKEKNNDP